MTPGAAFGATPGAIPWPAANPWGAPVLFVERTRSTMEEAVRLREQGLPSGTVIAAGWQEAGRGRLAARRWEAAPGCSLLFTLMLDLPPGLPAQSLPVLAGLSLCLALESRFSLTPRVKWPNDLLHDGRKLAGVLCEAHSLPHRPVSVLIGIGLNCNQRAFPPELAGRACSLYQLLGREVALPGVLEAVLTAVEAELRDPGWVPKLTRRLHGLGRAATVLPARGPKVPGETLRGVVAGIAGDGALLLESAGSTRAVYSGELVLQTDP